MIGRLERMRAGKRSGALVGRPSVADGGRSGAEEGGARIGDAHGLGALHELLADEAVERAPVVGGRGAGGAGDALERLELLVGELRGGRPSVRNSAPRG